MKLLCWLLLVVLIIFVADVSCKRSRKTNLKSIRRSKRFRIINRFRIQGRNKKKTIQSKPKRKNLKSGKLVKIDHAPEDKGTFNMPENSTSGAFRKDQYYVDPAIFDKLEKVNNMEDFIRIFKPSGYEIRKEPVIEKEIAPSILGGVHSLGRKPNGEERTETKSEDVIYFNNRKVSAVAKDEFQLGCTPKPTAHAITPKPGVVYVPWCVQLKQCGGCCHVSMECVPLTFANLTKQIFMMDGKTRPRQTPMTFLEHASCGCKCIVKKTDCRPEQTYNERRCQCECNRKPENCASIKHWSTAECDCICSNRRPCKSRVRTWDEKSCKCACIKDPCPQGKERNKESCKCVSIGSDATFRTDASSTSKSSSSNPLSGSKKNGWTPPSIDDVFSDDPDDHDDRVDDDDFDHHDDDFMR